MSCADCGVAPWEMCRCSDDYAELEAEAEACADRLDEHGSTGFVAASFATVNGPACCPKDGDPGASPQGVVSPAPAADPSCGEPSTTLTGESAVRELKSSRGEAPVPSPVEHRHEGRAA